MLITQLITLHSIPKAGAKIPNRGAFFHSTQLYSEKRKYLLRSIKKKKKKYKQYTNFYPAILIEYFASTSSNLSVTNRTTNNTEGP